MLEKRSSRKKITVEFILSRIFGVFFALIGFVDVFSRPLLGIITLIMSAVLLPPVTKLLDQKWNFNISGGRKVIVIIIGLIFIAIIVDNNNISKNEEDNNEEIIENVEEKPIKDSKKNEELLQIESNEKGINEGDVTGNIQKEKITGDQANEQQLQTETNIQNNNEEVEKTPIVFDIPFLLEKDIYYFTTLFGQPTNDNPEPTDIALEVGVETWTKSFEKNGYSIAVTYNIDNGDISTIFLSKSTYDMPLEETWITKNEIDDFLKRGNIKKDATGYYYRFMLPIQEKSKYTGVEAKTEPFINYEGEQLCNGYPEC